MNEKSKRFIILVSIIFIGVISRLIPHVANIAPIAAIALFGGAYFLDKKWGMIIPILALFISDFIMQVQFWLGYSEFPGFYNSMIFVYGSFALIVGLGYLLKGRVNLFNVFGASIAATAIFYLITNFGVWMTINGAEAIYPRSFSGLILCYEAGLPFVLRSLIGNIIFTGALFGVYELVLRSNSNMALSKANLND